MGLEPKVYKNFITEDERLELLHYSKSIPLFVNSKYKPNHDKWDLDQSGPYGSRCFAKLDGTGYSTPLIKLLFQRIVETIKLQNPVIDPMIGQIISVIKPNGLIHPHKDEYRDSVYRNKHNFRFNIMIDRGSDDSYNPIIEDKMLVIDKGDAWYFNASKFMHRTRTISGPENRVVYQFGFAVDEGEI